MGKRERIVKGKAERDKGREKGKKTYSIHKNQLHQRSNSSQRIAQNDAHKPHVEERESVLPSQLVAELLQEEGSHHFGKVGRLDQRTEVENS